MFPGKWLQVPSYETLAARYSHTSPRPILHDHVCVRIAAIQISLLLPLKAKSRGRSHPPSRNFREFAWPCPRDPYNLRLAPLAVVQGKKWQPVGSGCVDGYVSKEKSIAELLAGSAGLCNCEGKLNEIKQLIKVPAPPGRS